MTNPEMMKRSGGCGCGCTRMGNYRTGGRDRAPMGCGMTRESRCPEEKSGCARMGAELRKLEFAIVDTALYLDAYPDCKEALAYYHKLLCERDALRKRLVEECGPLTIYENVSDEAWDWVNGAWPWQPEAN